MATQIISADTFNDIDYEEVIYLNIIDGNRQCWVNAENKELLMSQLQSETITIPSINKATKSMQELFMNFLDCGLTVDINDGDITFCMEEAGIKSKKQFFSEIKSDIEKFGLDDVIEFSNGDITIYGDFREKFSFKY